MTPSLKEENLLWRKGFLRIAGLDEAGRGPLAGPVVAAAVVIKNPKFKKIKGVKNSKDLSEKQRELLYKKIIGHKDLAWGISIVSETVIDKINILQATKLAMKKSLKNLQANFLLIDGNFSIDVAPGRLRQGYDGPMQKSIIKGDEKVFSIAAASIIAKVTRDRLMKKYHQKYPNYGFENHKGYGTPAHLANLQKFGPCKIHRKTFYPVKTY